MGHARRKVVMESMPDMSRRHQGRRQHSERRSHEVTVDRWMAQVPPHPPDDVITALERSVGALWRRADATLGAASLKAVMERVLHDASMRFPVFAAVALDSATGIRVADLRTRVKAEDAQQLYEGTRYVLIQFLTVVGNLTAEILTPVLHAALTHAGSDEPAAAASPAPRPADQVSEDTAQTFERGLPSLETGVPNLDLILGQGIPKGSVTIVAGPPGSGKTILAQQFCFHNATAERPALYFNTLSEPVAKTLLYMGQFSYFDRGKIDRVIHLVDLGELMRSHGEEAAASALIEHVKRVKPGVVVIDSFKSFDDLNPSGERMRKFGYQVAVQLMAWEATALLLGEYAPGDYKTKPFFSIADGLIALYHAEVSGEWQRFIQVHKMRGIPHNRDPHAFAIGQDGLRAFTPRLTIKRSPETDIQQRSAARLQTGITGLDELIGEGIPHGSSLLLSGGPGTGKTVLLLDFIFQGARAEEKGVLFSFEETPERLRASARGLGWDLDREIDRGLIEIVFIPQPDIMLEADLLMMQEKVGAMGARRVAIDSVSVFLHKVRDKRIAQEKTFQIATIVQNAGAVGFFATDIPYGMDLLSRFGIEETIVDGVVLLTATETGFQRRRYLEVYKLRNTAHANGRHELVIAEGKVAVIPRRVQDRRAHAAAAAPRQRDGRSERWREGLG
jgi:circadian clock protein KaiC